MATTQFHEVHSYDMEISVSDLLCTVGQLIYSWKKNPDTFSIIT